MIMKFVLLSSSWSVPVHTVEPVVETDVLIVGSGPAGASAALALSTYGVRNIVVTRYASLADTPRAHITNQRTMEVLRDLGVERTR